MLIAFFLLLSSIFLPQAGLQSAYNQSAHNQIARDLSKKDLQKQVDIVIFSYDRPMQLYACLESIERYFTGYQTISVIYRTSNDEYEKNYQVVANRFPKVVLFHQTVTPHNNFKELLLSSAFSKTASSKYIMFAVDDIIVTNFVQLKDCTKALEKYKVWGFFLRLGKNIQHCSIQNKPAHPPRGKRIHHTFFLWKFSHGMTDWRYPNNVDMTIYRKKDIQLMLQKENYLNPNALETVWWAHWADYSKLGICFQYSQIVNIPMNIVQTLYKNRHNHTYSIEELLLKFQQGFKIDILQFYRKRYNSVHVDAKPLFIQR